MEVRELCGFHCVQTEHIKGWAGVVSGQTMQVVKIQAGDTRLRSGMLTRVVSVTPPMSRPQIKCLYITVKWKTEPSCTLTRDDALSAHTPVLPFRSEGDSRVCHAAPAGVGLVGGASLPVNLPLGVQVQWMQNHHERKVVVLKVVTLGTHAEKGRPQLPLTGRLFFYCPSPVPCRPPPCIPSLFYILFPYPSPPPTPHLKLFGGHCLSSFWSICWFFYFKTIAAGQKFEEYEWNYVWCPLMFWFEMTADKFVYIVY